MSGAGGTPPPSAPDDDDGRAPPEAAVRRPRATPSLKARALQYLALREHSRSELRRKLLTIAAAESAEGRVPEGEAALTPPQRVDALLDWLEANRHLSQARFVESRIHARAARFGNLRIRQELAQHGVAMPEAAAEQLKDSELDRARAVWQRKFAAAPVADAAARARQARFLSGRGFSSDTVRRVLREAGRGDPDEPSD